MRILSLMIVICAVRMLLYRFAAVFTDNMLNLSEAAAALFLKAISNAMNTE